MNYLLMIPILAIVSAAPAENVLIPLREPDSAVLLLDHGTSSSRPEVVVPATQSPGRVIVERAKNPDTNDWTGVRWVLRFGLSKAPATVQQAKLHLWCLPPSAKPGAPARLELIRVASPTGIIAVDRTSPAMSKETIEIAVVDRPQAVELDVTALVKVALKEKLSMAAFRIKAVCETDDCESAKEAPANYFFGGYTNVWSWPDYQAPLLEIAP
jgi:hypothetical protein